MKKLYILIIMVYSSLVAVSPILGTKVVNLFGVKFTAGIFTMLAAFSLLDVVNELWGKNDARFLAVFIILIRIVIFVGIIPVVIRLPSYLEPSGYSSLLQMSIRTFLASEVNTLIQNVLIDIPIFHRLKRIKFGFFFRANVSNLISWSFGTVCFVLISFWGSGKALLPIMLGQTFIKFPLSFVYAWIGLLIVNRAKTIRAAEKPIGCGLAG
jgi:queuosine precursor transporter